MAVTKCRVHDNCWMVDWRPSGRKGPHPQRHFPGTEAEAIAFHMEMVRLSRRARHQPVGFDQKVRDLLPDWKKDYRNNHLPNTVRDLENSLVPLVRFFGSMHLSELCPTVFEQYKAQRLATKVTPAKRKAESPEEYEKRRATQTRTISKRTINKELSYFSGFLKWCQDNSYLDQSVRVKKFPPKHTIPAQPIQPLFPEDIDALVAHIEPRYLPIFLLLNDAGLRRTEALTLTAEQVDLRRRVIVVIGKGNKLRLMPITTDRLHAALFVTLEKTKKGPLFVNPKTNKTYHSIRKPLLRAAAKAGIDQRLYHHLLRHTFCTVAISAGINPRSVQEMAGHASFQTTEMYIHLAGAYHQAEAAKFEQYLKTRGTDTVSEAKTAQRPRLRRRRDHSGN